MTLAFPSPEFDDVVAAACHGSITEAEACALNALLRTRGDARDEYLLRVELHSRLASERDLFSQADLATAVSVPAAGGGRLDSPAAKREPDLLSSVAAVSPRRRMSARMLAFAACLALIGVGVWSVWFRQPASRAGATGAAVAMLTRVVDAHWAHGDAPPRVGSALNPGWLRLESGLAQVVFHSGARVVIEGPAELKLVSSGEAVCPRGRLLAEVPEPARGFRLTTDQLRVVDLGTAFGVNADQERTEVHVFTGYVELLPQSADKQSLREGQAVEVRGTSPPRLMAANAVAFTSLLDFQQRSLAAEAFRYEQWQFANARLRQDPSLLVHLDFQDLSGVDWQLHNAAERSQAVPDAFVVGGQRTEGRWREKQALELQSASDRVRLVVPGEYEALTLSAWVRVSRLDRQLNSLFMCDGFESGTIHWLIRRDGVLGLTVFGVEPGQFEILASPPVLARDQLGAWLHLSVVLDGPGGRVVHYLNGHPVSRHAVKLGLPFRLGSAELGNWIAPTGSNPTPNLIRNLSGAFDEFELFSRALTDAEIRELYVKGNPDL